MRRMLLAAGALAGLTAMTTLHAAAAPSAAGFHAAPAQSLATNVDYYWNRRHWRHRHWHRGHWRYWN